jgi:hypothetical protein
MSLVGEWVSRALSGRDFIMCSGTVCPFDLQGPEIDFWRRKKMMKEKK